MAPRITKQTKVILRDKEKETPTQSDPVAPRLTLEMDPVSFTVSIKLIFTLNLPGGAGWG
jgi:hypothetical protein